MLMNRFFLLLCACGVSMMSADAWAGSVTLSTVSGRQFTSKEGSTLPTGCAVRIGTFNLPNATRDAQVQSTGDYAQLKAWFKPLAEGIVGAGSSQQAGGSGSLLRANGFPAAGDVFGTISDVSAGYMASGTQLYIWVFDHAVPDQSSQWGIYTLSTWQVPPALGSEVLSTAEGVVALQGTVSEGQLKLTTPTATYGNWSWKNYSLNAPAATASVSADPDGDGIANLAEYAWQLDPLKADQPRTSVEAGTHRFLFKSPRQLADVRVVAEMSPDLKTWSPADASVIASNSLFDTLAAAAPPVGNCFWRVRFTVVTAP